MSPQRNTFRHPPSSQQHTFDSPSQQSGFNRSNFTEREGHPTVSFRKIHWGYTPLHHRSLFYSRSTMRATKLTAKSTPPSIKPSVSISTQRRSLFPPQQNSRQVRGRRRARSICSGATSLCIISALPHPTRMQCSHTRTQL